MEIIAMVGKGSKSRKVMDANDVISVLAEKHKDDIFVPECNAGSAHAACRRLDAWVLKRTWSPVTTIGYEVKVSRQDFISDNKWPEYLDYCHQFYFVCPAGLIRKEEVANGVGLIWLSKSGKFHVKVKSTHHEPGKLNKIMTYVLMSRTIIAGNMWEANSKTVGPSNDRACRIKKYRDTIDAGTELAYFVRGHIYEKINEVNSKLAEAKSIEREAKHMSKMLAKYGIDWEHGMGTWRPEQQVRKLAGALPTGISQTVAHAVNMLQSMQSAIKEIEDAK